MARTLIQGKNLARISLLTRDNRCMEASFALTFCEAYASPFRTPPNKATPPTSVVSANYGGPPTSEHFCSTEKLTPELTRPNSQSQNVEGRGQNAEAEATSKGRVRNAEAEIFKG